MKKYRPVSLKQVKTYSITKRKSKVSIPGLATPLVRGDTFKSLITEHGEVYQIAVHEDNNSFKLNEYLSKLQASCTSYLHHGFSLTQKYPSLAKRGEGRFYES